MIYDSIIIGAGPAGIAASLYIKRSNLEVLVFNDNNSALKKAKTIDNYYGSMSISGEDLFNNGIKQAKDLGIVIKNEEVISIKMEMVDNNIGYRVESVDNVYYTKTIIISTGISRQMPNIANIKDYVNANISYCAICDGFFYKNKPVVVLGYSKYALAEAYELLKVTDNVTILTNDKSIDFVIPEKISVVDEKIIEFIGENKIKQIKLESSVIDCDGVFIAWGTAGGYEFSRKLGIETNNNKIVVNEKMETNIPGIYACGDVTGAPYQIYKAVYEGSTAGLSVSEYLKKK